MVQQKQIPVIFLGSWIVEDINAVSGQQVPVPVEDKKEKEMFWILHIMALLFFAPALFVTIPLHMIYLKNN